MALISRITNLVLGSAPTTYSSQYFAGVMNQLSTFGTAVSRALNSVALSIQISDPQIYVSNFTPDFSQSVVFVINPGGVLTVSNPLNINIPTSTQSNGFYLPSGVFVINQGSTAHAVSFDTQYSFSSSLPTSVGSTNKSLVIQFQVVNSSKVILTPGAAYA